MKKTTVLLLLACGLITCGCQKHSPSVVQENQEIHANQPNPLHDWVLALSQDQDFWNELVRPQSQQSPALALALEKHLGECSDPIVQAHYTSGEKRLISLIDPQQDAKNAIEILTTTEKHGISYKPEHIEKTLQIYESWSKGTASPELSFEQADWESMAKKLADLSFDYKQPNAKEELLKQLRSEKCANISPKICTYFDDVQKNAQASADSTAQLDVLLTCDILHWAQVLRLNYRSNLYTFDRWKEWIEDETLVRVRSKVFLQDLQAVGPKKAVERLIPKDLQYQKLMDARQTYINAIAAGGWPEVSANIPAKKEPKIGDSYPWVSPLRARLNAENYDAGDVSNTILDESLIAVVDLYRATHQLNAKNHIDKTLFKNLAVPPHNRLATIDVALQRYREAGASTLSYYILVNLPDFYAEVWKNNERLTRFRIVIGNNQMQKDPVTKKPVLDEITKEPIHPNRTPLITSKMNEIIYNPYWNVPPRIRIEELEPKLAANPNYYIENNYEEVNVGDPKLYYVRELPNPNNSLGLIKFMFPNPYNVYLHDTNAKPIFKNPTRANSHGCMRVENPFDLAEILLKEDGQWDPKYIRSIRETEPLVQTSVFLKKPVDVVIVYFNARVDDTGVVAFLSDVYQYDEPLFKVRLEELKNLYPLPVKESLNKI